jgi:uncharacterized protein (DUF983 family)
MAAKLIGASGLIIWPNSVEHHGPTCDHHNHHHHHHHLIIIIIIIIIAYLMMSRMMMMMMQQRPSGMETRPRAHLLELWELGGIKLAVAEVARLGQARGALVATSALMVIHGTHGPV